MNDAEPRVAPRTKQLLKAAASAALVGCIALFFYRAFRRNWASIAEHQFRLSYGYLALSAACLLAAYLLSTAAFQRTMNGLSEHARLNFAQSVAVVNTSSLVKYLPGKIWSYALQLYWLASLGFSKSLVAYANALNLFISIITSLICAAGLMFAFTDVIARQLSGLSLLLLALLDGLVIAFHARLLKWLVETANRLLKRGIQYFDPSTRLLLHLHGLHFASAVVFGAALCFIGIGIGYEVPLRSAPLMMAAFLAGDVIGFLAVFVPGGFGVREGVMYALLAGSFSASLPLVLPIAARGVSMVVDALLGLVAFRLLKRLAPTQR